MIQKRNQILIIVILLVILIDGIMVITDKSNHLKTNSLENSDSKKDENDTAIYTKNYTCNGIDILKKEVGLTYRIQLEYFFHVNEEKKIETANLNTILSFESENDMKKYLINNKIEDPQIIQKIEEENNKIVETKVMMFQNTAATEVDTFTDDYFAILKSNGFECDGQ